MLQSPKRSSGGLRYEGGSQGESSIPSIDFSGILAAVRRQMRPVLIGICIGAAVGLAFFIAKTPVYFAGTQLLLDSKSKVNDEVAVTALSELGLDTGAVDSQVEVLKSLNIANSVIAKVGLDRVLDDNTVQSPVASVISALKSGIRSIKEAILPPRKPTPEDVEAAQREAALAYLAGNMSLKRVGRTYVIEIGFASTQPDKAAQIANAFTQSYLDDQFSANFEATRRATDWLLPRIQELRQKAIETDLAVQKFRGEKGLITTSTGSLVNEQQVGEINTQLVLARSDVARADAKYDRIQSIISAGQMDAAVSEAIDNPIIVELRNKATAAAKTESELAAKLGPNHYQVQRLRSDLAEYRRLIFSELGRIAESYRSERDIAIAREKALEAQLKNQVGLTDVANKDKVALRELEREADTYKNLYETMLQRYQESLQKQSFPVSEARVISAATVPSQPASPKLALSVILGAILGFIGGAGYGAVRELRDLGFRSASQIRDLLRLECIGVMPRISPRQLALVPPIAKSGPGQVGGSGMMRYATNHILSPFAETLRSAKVAVDFAVGEKVPKIIALASVLPTEGKSTISKNFASMLAQLGTRTVLIDADLRFRGLSDDIAPHAQKGLFHILSQGAPVSSVMMVEAETGLGFIPAGADIGSAHTSNLVSSPAMGQLLADLGTKADYIVIDLPPLGPVVDVRAAAKYFDGVLFVLEWGATSRDLVVDAFEANPQVYEKCIGVILNKVDTHRLHFYTSKVPQDGLHKKYAAYYG
ncbi:AAA family ATPase [Xanthobacter autotrophicus]|uniref:GNVR domain-containing protein n=1 Tax=Xanthobacter TaxID=279 RepID=UPI0024AAF805|nr:GNVR domain-containing protein [Xanthobacter autotrophicus]MDI4664834.1 AAA family ATPase [Xanthobacter autotrophicus]